MSPSILLINPNTSTKTTEMMLAAARPLLGNRGKLRGVTATRGATMIVNDENLAIAASEVVRIGQAEAKREDCIIVGAFGNPGVEELRRSLPCTVIGIGEAAVLEAASGKRRFGIATTTPDLISSIDRGVKSLSLASAFSGVRVSRGDPLTLANDPDAQCSALRDAVTECLELDGAEAVVIGGGPLSDSARALWESFGDVIVQPLPAVIRFCLKAVRDGSPD